MIAILAFALCFASLSSASFLDHPLLSPRANKDKVVGCVQAHQRAVLECVADLSKQITKHEDDINKHQTDPENQSEETKKDVCCAEWKAEDCVLDVVNDTPGCVDAMKEAFKERAERKAKVCGTKYARGGPGCK